jgi:hypothetical protein
MGDAFKWVLARAKTKPAIYAGLMLLGLLLSSGYFHTLLSEARIQTDTPVVTDQAFEAMLASGHVSLPERGYRWDVSLGRIANGAYAIRSRAQILDTIHWMANTLIIADAIWGRLFITNGRVNGLIIEVMASSQFTANEKDRLLQILWGWRDRDFSQGVRDHNFVWTMLDGTVGRAYGLRWHIRLRESLSSRRRND